MILRLHVAGYKSIQHMDLRLGPLNVLIGSNGAGKSNLISIFRLLNQIVQQRLQVYVGQSGGPDALLHFGRRSSERIALDLAWDNTNEYQCSLVPTAENTMLFENERCLYGATQRDFGLGSGHLE